MDHDASPLRDEVPHQCDLRGQLGRPLDRLGGRCDGGRFADLGASDLGLRGIPCTTEILELRPQPANQTAPLFGRAFGIERDESFEDLLVAEVVRPAVGVGDRGVDVVVDLLQHGDEPVLADLLFRRAELRATAQLLQHVVHAGGGEVGVLGLLALAVGVEGFGEGANARLLEFGGGGEWEWVKAAGLVVTRIAANTEPSAGC